MSALASGDFRAFVGVVAGIYTIFALGLQLQFGFAGLLNFGQVALIWRSSFQLPSAIPRRTP